MIEIFKFHIYSMKSAITAIFKKKWWQFEIKKTQQTLS
jgi:hypothetical protein